MNVKMQNERLLKTGTIMENSIYQESIWYKTMFLITEKVQERFSAKEIQKQLGLKKI